VSSLFNRQYGMHYGLSENMLLETCHSMITLTNSYCYRGGADPQPPQRRPTRFLQIRGLGGTACREGGELVALVCYEQRNSIAVHC
jgi:hypothetical protein